MGYDPAKALLDELVAGRVVAVVGAGFTIATTSPDRPASWPALIRHGAEYARAHHRLTEQELDEIETALSSSDAATLVAAAERVEQALRSGNGTWRRWLKESVARFDVASGALLRALRHLNVPLATTNYDTLLSAGRVPAISWRAFGEVEAFFREKAGVLHLHGVHTDEESIVFGRGSYETILDNRLAQFGQQILGKVSTLLFVGCGPGLRDPNIGALFEWLEENELSHPHYRLVIEGEAAERVADCVTDVVFGADYRDLPTFIEALALDRDDRVLGRTGPSRIDAMRAGRAAGPSPTYLLCDVDPQSVGEVPIFLPARPWQGPPEGTAVPLRALRSLARTLQSDGDLPTFILIDDVCPWAPGEKEGHNAARTMAGLTRLFDAYGLDRASRPICVRFSYIPTSLRDELTFMEFGGDGIVDRQPGDEDEVERLRDVLDRIRDGELGWRPPRPLAGVPDDTGFWEQLFPLLPLLDDHGFTSARDIRELLDIDSDTLDSRIETLDGRLRAAVELAPAEVRREVTRFRGGAAVRTAALHLGYAWIAQEKLRDADDIDWDHVLPVAAPEVPPLRLRSSVDEAVRAAWYRHTHDPRGRVGADWPPSPYLRSASA
ncbi:SIR2 family protein [Solirubrobacter phytolaccae]|uniref:SIR2 family protein n=1 Tax=Solirubrobacter phytolaccae TaxID=1404360 RepID=A0A9X3N414_9ACTN|nr:SIR2 family protein [Solirubrobacter phytolaccae]MDA0179293.1 SIR2 family protein [Solirubrobacter phytolaccae]